MVILRELKRRSRWIQRDTYALYLACRDPRTPRLAKILGAVIVAYALSPIDLIPDFIPILGSLDDLIIVPLGFSIVLRMIPPEVMADCRARADVVARRSSKIMVVVVVSIWLLLAMFTLYVLARAFNLLPSD